MELKTIKLTKKIILTAMVKLFEEHFAEIPDVQVDETTVTYNDIMKFINNQIEMLEKKKEKERERAEKKKAEKKTDYIIIEVEKLLTDEWQSATDILDGLDQEFIEKEEVTKAKVTNRLSALVRDGKAEKAEARHNKKQIIVYKLTSTSVVE